MLDCLLSEGVSTIPITINRNQRNEIPAMKQAGNRKAGEIMKKIRMMIMVMIMVMAMGASSFAAAVDQNGAVNIALQNAGLSADQVVGLEAELDGSKYEIEFHDAGTGDEYSYDIKASTGKIVEKSVDFKYTKNTSKKKISKKAARKKAAAITGVKYKTVKKGSIKYKYKKKQGKYTLKFKSGGYRYEVEIQAATGKVIDLEMDATKKK